MIGNTATVISLQLLLGHWVVTNSVWCLIINYNRS